MTPPRRQIAVCLHESTGFTTAITQGLAAFAQHRPRWGMFIRTNTGQGLAAVLRGWDGDGLICSLISDRDAAWVRRRGFPVVNVAGTLRKPGVTSVLGDDVSIGRLGAAHFLERGFRHFAALDFASSHFARKRVEGFTQAVREAGGIVHPSAELADLFPMPWRKQLEHLRDWLRPIPRPTAVFAVFDPAAHLVVEACHLAGLRVPDDVAVLGVDDDPVYCALTNPPLSSVRTGLHQRGYRAAELLDALMEGHAQPGSIQRVPADGVISRRSTDVFAVADAKVTEALRFIEQETAAHLQVDDVAGAVSMSRRNLERRFRNSMGRTVYDEIRRRRLETAKQLLCDRQISILRIALDSGFSSASDLSNAFKRHLGMTPTDYRNQFSRT